VIQGFKHPESGNRANPAIPPNPRMARFCQDSLIFLFCNDNAGKMQFFSVFSQTRFRINRSGFQKLAYLTQT